MVEVSIVDRIAVAVCDHSQQPIVVRSVPNTGRHKVVEFGCPTCPLRAWICKAHARLLDDNGRCEAPADMSDAIERMFTARRWAVPFHPAPRGVGESVILAFQHTIKDIEHLYNTTRDTTEPDRLLRQVGLDMAEPDLYSVIKPGHVRDARLVSLPTSAPFVI